VLELFRRAEAAAGEGKPLEPETHVEGVLTDDGADEFRRRSSPKSVTALCPAGDSAQGGGGFEIAAP
jgi:hypothetical protein